MLFLYDVGVVAIKLSRDAGLGISGIRFPRYQIYNQDVLAPISMHGGNYVA